MSSFRFALAGLLASALTVSSACAQSSVPVLPSTNTPASSNSTPHEGTMDVKSLKTCFVIYRQSSYGHKRWSDAQLMAIRNAGELVRLFYFRNTGARLNLDIQYILIDAPLPKAKEGTPFEDDLKARGAQEKTYDLLYITGPDTVYNRGGADLLGGTKGGIGGSVDLPPLSNYPENRPDINYGMAWVFAHEIHHALDSLVGESGGRNLLSCHPYSDSKSAGFKGNYRGGEHWDWVALTLREFPVTEWVNIPGVRDLKLTCADADGDGFPDSDARLPMDEKRFGSSPARIDSDGDGLKDVTEFSVSIYAGSNPVSQDSDSDGVADRQDAYPLVNISRTLPYLTSKEDAAPVITGAVARNDGGGTVAVYGGWNEVGLHF
jgi:hypothetical protein